jgi:hypothetical protein
LDDLSTGGVNRSHQKRPLGKGQPPPQKYSDDEQNPHQTSPANKATKNATMNAHRREQATLVLVTDRPAQLAPISRRPKNSLKILTG